MDEDAQEIKAIAEEFKFKLELDPSNDRVMFMRFEDTRNYRLEHPGAFAVARLFGSTSESLVSDCFEYFIENCIRPEADNKTKVLNDETLDLNEALHMWMPFAWRWLRRSHGITGQTA